MTNNNLYQITQELDAIMIAFDSGLYDENEFEAVMNKWNADLDSKLSNTCAYYKNESAQIDAIDAEVKRLKARKEMIENRLERTNKYLVGLLGPRAKWTNGVHALGFKRSEAAVPTDSNPDGVAPEAFTRVKITHEPKKTEIKVAINGGAEVPGWRVEERYNLQVK